MASVPRGTGAIPFADFAAQKFRLKVPASLLIGEGARTKLVLWSTSAVVMLGRICIGWVHEMEACPRPGRAIGQLAFYASRRLARRLLRRQAYERLGNAWHRLRRHGAKH